jgi:uncharacterized caspase-like protein
MNVIRWASTGVCFVLAWILSLSLAWAEPADARRLPTIDGRQRLALVVGNAAYKASPLLNPVNDARSITLALREAGFTVIHRENADRKALTAALREFGDRLRAGGTGLFYFSGHGMQIKGRNYLVPTDAVVEREDEAAYQTVDAQAVLDKMEAAGNLANIMILDACRNNPFARSSRASAQGLAQMDAPTGTLVAYATAPGSVASDGVGLGNGLYTRHLLDAMRKPGTKLEEVFKQVRAGVRRESQGAQVPWESTSFEGDFYFFGAAQADAPGGVAETRPTGLTVHETALWEAVKDSKVPAELSLYLARHPDGAYATLARLRLAALTGPSPLPASAGLPAQPPSPHERPGATTNVASPQAVASNVAGFTVGDRWRFQVVDKFKAEVVRNYAFTVDGVLPDGRLAINGGQARWDAHGNLLTESTADEEVSFSNYLVVPPVLSPGVKTPLAYEIIRKTGGKETTRDAGRGSMTVRGQEKITVPAGEFTAWRIEIEVYGNSYGGTDYRAMQGGSRTWRRAMTGWYAPELRAYVAFDEEFRVAAGIQNSSTGTFTQRERHELTSFSVKGAENLAQR